MENESSDDFKIAGKLKISDWENLFDEKRKLKSDNWEKAFNFFEERIRTRYLKPIRLIQYASCDLGEGFAMVSLQCALIETVESFINGWIYKYDNGPKYYLRDCNNEANLQAKINGTFIFDSFFKKREPFRDFRIDGKHFFKYVRCGLLHETQIKKGWVIRTKHETEFYEEQGSQKIIYRSNFQDALEKVISDYKEAIITGTKFGDIESEDLRLNFKAKFEHICNISKPQ